MLKQSLQQKLQQKLSPQQIQLMKLLQVPTASLEQRIKEELEINPALEEGLNDDDKNADDEESIYEQDDYETEGNDENKREDFNLDQYIDDDEIPSYKTTIQSSSDDDIKDVPFASGISFQEQLTEQLHLRNLTDKQMRIADYVIGYIDDDGYMRRELAAMVDDLAFTQNITATEKEIEVILTEIQDLDPAGIGARNLRECLLIQLKRKENRTKGIRLATEIVSEMMEEFVKKHYDKIAQHLDFTPEELKLAINEIIHLNPKPGNSMADNQKNLEQITPDFALYNNDGKLELSLNGRNRVPLRVSKDYNDMLNQYSKGKLKDKEAVSFIKQKIESANWFIDALDQRNQSMMLVMNCILTKQYDYFLEGDELKLKPMILKDVADVTNLDISTVSRISNAKYITTHFGTFALKSFFSESLTNDDGEEVSSKEVKKILSNAIADENKAEPLSDEALVTVLKAQGYNIARRTIAKYREMLNIPVARLRKEL